MFHKNTKIFFKEFLVKRSKFILIFFFLIIFIQASISSLLKSPAWDERDFIGYGRHVIERGSFKFDPSSSEPILSYYLNSIFLIFLKIDDKVWFKDDFYQNVSNELIYHSGYDPRLILYLVRLPNILLSLLLAYFLFKWSKELYGTNAGFFALLLYSFSPMMLANIRVAHTELPMACFSFISLYYFWKFYNIPNLKYLILTSITVSLAILCKTPAIILIPIYIVFILLQRKYTLKKKLYSFGIIFSIIFLTIWIAYGFQFQPLKYALPDHYMGRAYEEFKKIENDILRDSILYTFEEIPLPFTSFIGHIGHLYQNVNRGLTGYFFGKIFDSRDKPLYYFLVAFLIKTPIPILFFLLLTLIFFNQIKNKKVNLELLISLPIIVLFILLSFNKLSYPLRHMLVIYPLLFLFVSKSVNIKIKRQKLFDYFFIILIVWYVINSISVFPHHAAFFNEFVGGSKNGYKYLLAENVDTGEDLIGLKKYLIKNNINKINLSFHGSFDPAEYGISYDYMPSACWQFWVPDYKKYALNCKTNYSEDCSKREGIVVISVTNLQNRFLKNTSCFNWLKEYQPIENIGYSIHVYNISNI